MWIRPCDSVTGTRCTRCTPPSYFSRDQAPRRGAGVPRLDRDGRVLDAAEVGLGGVDDLGLPAVPLGVAQVHPQQVAGEQRGLLAALARLDLEDDVACRRSGSRGTSSAPQPLLELPRACLEGGRPRPRRRGPRRPARGRPARRRRSAATRGTRRRSASSSAYRLAELPGLIRVRVHAGVGERALELGVLASQRHRAASNTVATFLVSTCYRPRTPTEPTRT